MSIREKFQKSKKILDKQNKQREEFKAAKKDEYEYKQNEIK